MLQVPVAFVNQLLTYLMGRPCGEVLALVDRLGRLAQEQGLVQPAAAPSVEPSA